MRLVKVIIVFLLLSVVGKAQTYTYSGAAVAIVDNSAAYQYIPLTVNSNNAIMNSTFGVVSVSINISHTAVGDLYVGLLSPTGTIVDLAIFRGGTTDNFPNTVFNSSSATTIAAAASPYGVGPYAPEVHLGNFNLGVTSTGIWNLVVRDFASTNTGTVNSFSITFSGTPATPQVWMGAGLCTVYDCGPLKFYDYGGPSANYPNGFTTAVTQTFCTTSTTNTCLRATFNAGTTFVGSCAADYLDIFNGKTVDYVTAGVYVGSFCNGSYAAITVTSTSGCLTFAFRSNNTGNAAGWNADISCVTGCASVSPPSNDNCSGATTLVTSGTNANARGCDMAGIGNAISGASNCGWNSTDNSTFYTFNVTSGTPQPVTVDVTGATCSGGGNAVQLAVFDNNCNTVGTYGSNYHGCASGTGAVSVTASPNPLPIGTYILAVDGQAGASCTFSFNGAVVLPIALKSFSLTKEGKMAKLNWITSSEENNEHFELQKSSDAKLFETIAIVDAKGAPNVETEYNYYDERPATGLNYYRIVQVDVNGKKTFFPIRQLDFSDEVNSFIVYPNPLNEDNLFIDLTSKKSYEAIMEIYNSEGKLARKNTLLVEERDNRFSIDMTGLHDGIYIVKILTPNNMLQQKAIIARGEK